LPLSPPMRITDSNHVILSAIQSETIAQRFSPDCTLTKEDVEG